MKMFVSRKLSRNTLDFARNALPASMIIPNNIAHALHRFPVSSPASSTMPTLAFVAYTLLLASTTASAATFKLHKEYSGKSFFDDWDFASGPDDITHGTLPSTSNINSLHGAHATYRSEQLAESVSGEVFWPHLH